MKIPFDQYQRYKKTQEIIDSIRRKNHLNILEVGSNEHRLLNTFLSKDSILFLDKYVSDKYIDNPAFIKSDACNMSLEDDSFDFVITLDVFEHIPLKERGKFLDEIERVSRIGFVLASPFCSDEVLSAERRANEFFKILYGYDYPWLKEHLDLKLPVLEDTLGYLNKKNGQTKCFNHGSLFLWEKLIKIHFYAAGDEILYNYRTEIDEFYNKNLYVHDFSEPCYRTFIVKLHDKSFNLDVFNQEIPLDVLSNHITALNHLESSFYALGALVKNKNLVKEYIINPQAKTVEKCEEKLKLLNDNVEKHENLVQKVLESTEEVLEYKENFLSIYKNNIESLIASLNSANKKIDELTNRNFVFISVVKEYEQKFIDLEKQYEIERNKRLKVLNILRKRISKGKETQQKLNLYEESLRNKDADIQNLKNHVAKLEEIAQSLRIKNRIKRFTKKLIPLTLFKLAAIIIKNPFYIKRSIIEFKINGFRGLRNKVESKIISYNLNQNQQQSNYYPPEESADFVLTINPKISVIMPVYNVNPKWLNLAIKSVVNQTYDNWELCIVDDGSNNQDTIDFLMKTNGTDDRIKVSFLSENQGISMASNAAVNLAEGEFLALMDHDDELQAGALEYVVKAIEDTKADIIYSDEDKIDMNGTRKFPFFKPDWSPDLLRSQMYMGHLLVLRKSLFEKIGGFRKGFDGSQDYDLALRLVEQTKSIYHIPQILYSWRELDTSTSINPKSKPYAQLSGLRALNEHLERVFGKGNAWATECENTFVYDVRYKIPNEIKASIIIPTKDRIDLLKECIESIINKTSYKNYEILIMNNNSKEPDSLKWFDHITSKYSNIRVIDALYNFNWSKLNNHGVSEATGDIYVFLNNDTSVLNEEWLTRSIEKCSRNDVGVVGGLLLYEDKTIQHAGVVVGMGGWADHVFKCIKPIHFGSPFVSPMVTRNVLAVTGACLAISKKTFEKVGGFNEDFIICGSDVEIGIRCIKQGLINIYDPNIKLFHYESKTRDAYIPERDFELSALHYEPYRLQGDPYYNKNLNINSAIPSVNK